MPKITDGVYVVFGEDEVIPDSHTYLIGNPEVGDLSLIDPGLAGKGKNKLKCLQKMGIDLKNIKRIIMTHTHFDHIGCLAEIQKNIPAVEVWIHAREAEPLEKGDERTVYGMEMFRTMCQMQYGLKSGAFRFDVHRKLTGGEHLEMGNSVWEIVPVPGHSRGSIALYQPEKKILIPGDVIYADHAIGRFDLHGADGKEMMDSLLRLSEIDVNILLPGHNAIVEKVPPGYIRNTAKQWQPYLT